MRPQQEGSLRLQKAWQAPNQNRSAGDDPGVAGTDRKLRKKSAAEKFRDFRWRSLRSHRTHLSAHPGIGSTTFCRDVVASNDDFNASVCYIKQLTNFVVGLVGLLLYFIHGFERVSIDALSHGRVLCLMPEVTFDRYFCPKTMLIQVHT